MASTSYRSIYRKRKPPPDPVNLRREIVSREETKLKRRFVCVVGDEGTGRHTLVHRFLTMSSDASQEPENRRGRTSYILTNLSERPHIRRPRAVHLHVFIFNFQELDLETIHHIVGQVNSCIVIFDVGRSITFHTAIHCMIKITELLRSKAPRFILVGNKIDLHQREISADSGRRVARICSAQRYYDCSAQMNVNMDAVFDALLIMSVYPHSPLPR
ncbi:hypothetical protein AVEN_110115-1 [Araneus ventricosus]|uniref:small monomeric GTPase n=1 Tax=Araneus ventricosus TaxID=182803 RepID=A0A4Y2NJ65_ARAVE|nr:hypothetical protein AVEN_110115-1 [Araneus ventricosus]